MDGQRIVSALREALDRLVRARSIIEQAGTPATCDEDVKAVSLIRGLFAGGPQGGRDTQDVLSACDAVINLRAVASIDERNFLKIATLESGGGFFAMDEKIKTRLTQRAVQEASGAGQKKPAGEPPARPPQAQRRGDRSGGGRLTAQQSEVLRLVDKTWVRLYESPVPL